MRTLYWPVVLWAATFNLLIFIAYDALGGLIWASLGLGCACLAERISKVAKP